MAYIPGDHVVIAKALGASGDAPTDGRTMYLDKTVTPNKYRAFVSTAELIAYCTSAAQRQAALLYMVNSGGSLAAGVITGGTNSLYHWKDSKADGGLVQAIVTDAERTAWDAKQAALVSGTNIKTINGTSVLGSGDLVVSGGGGGPYTWSTKTANATLTTETHVKADATAGNISITLPSAASVTGIDIIIKKTDSTANTVTIVGTIDGVSNYIQYAQYESITLSSDGSTFQIL